MRRIVFFLAGLVAVCACSPKVCTISGSISDPVDSVCLVGMSGDILDRCAVTDGTFTLTCEVNPEIGVAILRGDRYEPISLIPDTREIFVSMADGKPVISGSPLSEGLQAFQQWAMSTFMEYEMRAMECIEKGQREEADAIVSERKKVITDHCREIYLDHKTDPLGNQAMSLMMEYLDKDEFLSLYEQGGKVIQGDPMIGGYYEHLTTLPHYDVVTLGENGEIAKKTGFFDDYVGAGKYTLVDFWASWCGPCREVTPEVVAAFEQYAGKGLIVIGIPVQDKQDATIAAMKELGIHYPQSLDPSQELAQKYGITAIPHIILFGPDGTILQRDLRGDALTRALEKYLCFSPQSGRKNPEDE